LSYVRWQLIPSIWMIWPVLGGFGWFQFHPSYVMSRNYITSIFVISMCDISGRVQWSSDFWLKTDRI
jgi:hypothetical protein